MALDTLSHQGFIEKFDHENLFRLNEWLRELRDNMSPVVGAYVTVTFPLANTDTQLNHGLNKIVTNYFCIQKTGYADFRNGVTAADTSNLYVQTDTAGVSAVFYVF